MNIIKYSANKHGKLTYRTANIFLNLNNPYKTNKDSILELVASLEEIDNNC